MQNQTIALVAAFNGNGELLLLKRPDNVHCAGLWSLPGGKVEAGESPLAAARRELFEETGLHGEDWRPLGGHEHAYPDRNLHFSLFACRVAGAVNLPDDIHAWVAGNALDRYPMPPANSEFVGLLTGAAGE